MSTWVSTLRRNRSRTNISSELGLWTLRLRFQLRSGVGEKALPLRHRNYYECVDSPTRQDMRPISLCKPHDFAQPSSCVA